MNMNIPARSRTSCRRGLALRAVAFLMPMLLPTASTLADTIVWINGPGDRHQRIIVRDIKTSVSPGGTSGYELLDEAGIALAFMGTDGADPFDHTNITEFAFTEAADRQLIEPISDAVLTLTSSDGRVTDDGTGKLFAADGIAMATLGFELMSAAGGPTSGSIMFGRFPPEHERTVVTRSGLCDCFGGGSEASRPRPLLASFITSINPNPGPATFDDIDVNEWFGHSFTDLPMGCVLGGKLTITARPLGSSANDSIWVGQTAKMGTTLTTHFAGWSYGDVAGSGLPALFPGQPWQTSTRPNPCGYTTTIDLGTRVGGGTMTLLDQINAMGVLDVYSQDDTAIDCLVLELDIDPDCTPRCPCPADFDGDGQLTIFDFLAFQNAFAMGCD